MGGTGLEERNPVVTVNKDDEKISRLKIGEGKLFVFFFFFGGGKSGELTTLQRSVTSFDAGVHLLDSRVSFPSHLRCRKRGVVQKCSASRGHVA